jgi:hypothetical protein
VAERFIHDDRFVESFANKDHVVLGKRLDPFCLWHQFNLEIAQSKLLLGEQLTALDLWVGVRICTTPWTPRHLVPDLNPPSKLKFIWDVGRYSFPDEVKKFSTYVEDYTPGPKFWPNQHKQEEGTIAPERDFDENLELALFAMKEGRFTWREVWTMPLGMLRWATTGLAKLGGAKIDIWTPEHEEMFLAHKKDREAKIDARGWEIAAEKNLPFEAARKQAHDEYWATVKTNLRNASSK